MANSKRKLLLNALRDTILPAITTGGGYNNSVQTIERGLKEIDSIPDSSFPAIYISRSTEERTNITINQFQSRLKVILVAYVKRADGSAQEVMDDFIEDISKALEQDRKQGGLVKWTEVKSIDTDDGDLDPHAACAIVVEFNYVSEGVTP